MSIENQKGNSAEDAIAYSVGILAAVQAIAINVVGHDPAMKKNLEKTLDLFIQDVPPQISNPDNYRAALTSVRGILKQVKFT